MDPLVVEVTRGEVVESRHRVHAAAVRHGDVVEHAGDPRLLTHLRSAAKPIQALPLVRARSDLADAEIAIACASHLARPDQVAAVRSLLGKAGASADDLECGPEPTRIEHNCSGKHAGMLALCAARGWPHDGYRRAGHPCQDAMLAEVVAVSELAPGEILTGVDGCGVVTFALPLDRMAHAFSRLARADGGDRVARAMSAHPDLIRGPSSPDTRLMRALPGWIAKGGAEAVLCASSPDGLGIALKVEDGAWRALPSAVSQLLARVGVESALPAEAPVTNSRGEVVGRVRPG